MTEALDLAEQIATELKERNHFLIQRVVTALGPERAQTFFEQTLAIEAGEGMLVRNEKRRRTPGGVFFYLVRKSLSNKEQREIWSQRAKTAKQPASALAAARPGLTWAAALALIPEAITSIGETKTVKLTIVGRPSKFAQQADCVVLAMKGKEPPAMPKGLPTPPANSAITWVVFIVNKQWNAVKESIAKNADDNLIVEGYPIVDPKSNATVLLATSCKSVLQERAGREAKGKVSR